MKNLIKISLFIICICVSNQIIFTQQNNGPLYFPLNVGDRYYFKKIHCDPGGCDTSYVVSKITHTAIFNGKTYYYCFNFLGGAGFNDSANYYLRYDSISGCLVKYDSTSPLCNYEFKMFNLAGSVGDSVGASCIWQQNFKCTRIFDTTLFGNIFNSKKFSYSYSGSNYFYLREVTFGRNLGCYISYSGAWTDQSFQTNGRYLKGAFINGVVFGDTTFNDYHIINGTVKYRDNNQNVSSGYVKAYRHSYLGSLEIVDSATIQSNGSYTLNRIPRDTIDLMAFQDDEVNSFDFVPTYYPSTIYWQEAGHLFLNADTAGIDIRVFRTVNDGSYSRKIGGGVYIYSLTTSIKGLPGAFIYARQGNYFRGYSISNSSGMYIIDSLPSGFYQVICTRMGYPAKTRYVYLGNNNRDSVNFYYNGLVGVQGQNLIPEKFSLYQNYPNPFNPTTKIRFEIPTLEGDRGRIVKIIVYDILGREISTLVNEQLKPGTYEVEFDGSSFASGVYFYKLETQDFSLTKCMVLIK